MASKNITLNSIVEADFVQEAPIEQLYDTGGIVYGVEADERDGNDDNLHRAHVELPQANNGIVPGIFSDELANGPHRINGAPGPGVNNPGDTDDDYVRLAW